MIKTGKMLSLAAILLLAVLAVAVAPANVSGTCDTDVWVAPPPLGSDANPGTQAQPFATIQKGIDFACANGTVHVAAGTYYEHLHINFAVNLTGAGAPITVIDGGLHGSGAVEASGIIGGTVITISSAPNEVNIISGFTIQNGSPEEANLWNPANEKVIYAGVKLPGMKILTQPTFFIGSCGGGIYIANTHIVTLNDCVIKNNTADEGGGICNSGQLTMNRCTVSGNTARFDGGGIANGPVGFFNNSADGPAPIPVLGSMSLTNCTISGNKLLEGIISEVEGYAGGGPIAGAGGGIYNSGHMELLNCTIANNSAGSAPDSIGGGFANTSLLTAIFKNTIVADNTAGNSTTNNGANGLDAVIISQGHNLDSEDSCGFNQPTDLINTDPLLGPLQDNGGPTFTCALPVNSPAVDTGDNSGAPATDQRGVSRPQGITVDIGAYELEGGRLLTSTETHPNISPANTNAWTRNLNPPTMSVQFVSVNPQQAVANQPVTISTNVVNTGDQGGNLNVTLKINGQVEETRMVSVGPQASQPIKFTVAKAQPGTYSIDIGGQTGSFTIPDNHSNKGAPANTGMIIFLALAVLAIAVVMVLLLNRRSA
jgi:hypothetical protein